MSRDNKGPRRKSSGERGSEFGKRKSFSSTDKPKRSGFKKSFDSNDSKPSFKSRDKGFAGKDDRAAKPYRKREDGKYESTGRTTYGDRDDKPKRSFTKTADGKYESAGRKSYGDRDDKPKRSFTKTADGKYESTGRKSYGDRDDKPKRSFTKTSDGKYEGGKRDAGFGGRKKSYDEGKSFPREKKQYKEFDESEKEFSGKPYTPRLSKQERVVEKTKKAGPKKTSTQQNVSPDAVRLNRYMANAGICSRREADVLIATGVVSVNGKVVTEMGYKVNPEDKVTYGGVPVKNENKKYLLLNKPKDYITTMDDPQERRTVMDLIRNACKERLYPVGRLDRNTTGVLLFTNDGDLTAKLTHPKFDVRKVYHVTLNKKMTSEDFKILNEGFELPDGFIKPDAAEFVGTGKMELGVEIHSGRNRIVRRMFEHLGYEVTKLDRVAFGGLTKKDLPRGKFRFLTEKEVGFLKMLG